ncbi:CHY zinc finger protein [Terribacillus sp. 179-K 1B1 HS]|uniref:CHY zinc finger protein n=1 Tax=Terribacillus sp. 179-K 1B1 HS TaxID=3142388 RepID=UPI0039A09683
MCQVHGKTVDGETRCEHYHSPLDVIAIKFACCNKFYPCHQCHEETAGHQAEVWSKDQFDEHAILCGVCKTTLSIDQYRHTNQCPNCKAAFNPGCNLHHHLYFEQMERGCR